MIKYGCFSALFSKRTKMPSIDTISRTLTFWDLKTLENSFDRIINILFKNKNFKNGTIDGYTVCAIDGTDVIHSPNKKCKGCALMKNGTMYYYAHKSIVTMIIGTEINYVLKQSMIKVKSEKTVINKKTYEEQAITKSEGELTVGTQLIEQLPPWVDVVVGDALYFKAPFIKKVLEHNKHVVIRLKNKKTHAYQTINHHTNYNMWQDCFTVNDQFEKITVSYWEKDSKIQDSKLLKNDAKKFTDIRLFKFIEVIESNIKGKEKFQFREIFLGCTDKNMSAKTVWKIMHQRWYIENTCFHQLKTYCAMEHCFKHDPIAIEAILNIMFMAFNIFRSFLFRRLKKFKVNFKKKKETISWFVEELTFELKNISFLIHLKFIKPDFLNP